MKRIDLLIDWNGQVNKLNMAFANTIPIFFVMLTKTFLFAGSTSMLVKTKSLSSLTDKKTCVNWLIKFRTKKTYGKENFFNAFEHFANLVSLIANNRITLLIGLRAISSFSYVLFLYHFQFTSGLAPCYSNSLSNRFLLLLF